MCNIRHDGQRRLKTVTVDTKYRPGFNPLFLSPVHTTNVVCKQPLLCILATASHSEHSNPRCRPKCRCKSAVCGWAFLFPLSACYHLHVPCHGVKMPCAQSPTWCTWRQIWTSTRTAVKSVVDGDHDWWQSGKAIGLAVRRTR
jgi:hypothetical protein